MDESDFRSYVIDALDLLHEAIYEANSKIDNITPEDGFGFSACTESPDLDKAGDALRKLRELMED